VLGLTPPDALEEAFEQEGGLKAARAEAEHQIVVLAAIARAGERLTEKESLLESIGLIGADPQGDLESARDGFEADALNDAAADADRALASRVGAEEAGQTRVLLSGGGIVLLSGGAVAGVQIRRRRRAATAMRAAGAASAPSSTAQPEEPAMEPLDPPA
jgi:hypothetical protein